MAGPTFSKSIEKAIRESAGDISDRSTCAAKTTATGLGITRANFGKKATFTITSRDSQDRERKLGGDVYAVKLNKEGYEIKVDVKDNDDGTYLAEYTVPDDQASLVISDHQAQSSMYTLSVWLRGANIKNSPFLVFVTRFPNKPRVLRSTLSNSLRDETIDCSPSRTSLCGTVISKNRKK